MSKEDIGFIARIEYGMKIKNLTKEDLANLLGVSKATLYRKFSEPSSFTVGEIRVMRKSLSLSDEDLISFT